jgi:hypothetical protein
MTSPLLTVARLQNQGEVETAVTPNWALYLAATGMALIGIAMFWQVYSNRQKARRAKPRAASAKTSFCHNCGQRNQKGDQFCRQCGTALK